MAGLVTSSSDRWNNHPGYIGGTGVTSYADDLDALQRRKDASKGMSDFFGGLGDKFGSGKGLTQLTSSAKALGKSFDPKTGEVSYGNVGEGVGGAVGFAVGGPVGAATGGVLGSVGGGLLDWWGGEDEREAAKKKAKEEKEMQRRLLEMAFQDRQREIKWDMEDRANLQEGRALDRRIDLMNFGERIQKSLEAIEARKRARMIGNTSAGFAARAGEFGGAF